MKTIHIEGYADSMDLKHMLSDSYNGLISSNDFCFEQETEYSVKNVFFRFYYSKEKCSLEDAIKGFVGKVYGELFATGQSYGYSEVTIEGFSILELTIGGHDIQKMIKARGNDYIHILIDTLSREVRE